MNNIAECIGFDDIAMEDIEFLRQKIKERDEREN